MATTAVGKRAWLWPVALMALVFAASSRSVLASPELPNTDKVGHFIMYGSIATMIVRLGRGWRAAVGAMLAASAYGATDEWHQYFVPGRSCDVFDWIADTSGAALAVGLYAGWPAYRRLLEMKIAWRRSAALKKSAQG